MNERGQYGSRSNALIGAQHLAPEAFRPMALRAVENWLENGYPVGRVWLYAITDTSLGPPQYIDGMGYLRPPPPFLNVFDDDTSTSNTLAEILRDSRVVYWAILKMGASAPQIVRDQVLIVGG